MISISKQAYGSEQMKNYEGLDAIRKRQGMYIGGNDSKALLHLLWEILDNSVDEAVAGFGDLIKVTLMPDGWIQVDDHGRGIPVDMREDGTTGVEMAFTKLHSGGKFDSTNYAAAGGLNGVGAAVVNALSTEVHVEVHRNKKIYTLSFKDGVPGHFSDKGRFTASSKVKSSGKTTVTGTTVKFRPNMNYFPGAEIDRTPIESRCKDRAFLIPGTTFTLSDLRDPENPYEVSYNFADGLSDWVTAESTTPLLSDVITCSGERPYKEKIVQLQDDGSAPLVEVDRTMQVELAFAWQSGYDTITRSFVNVVDTPAGGTHMVGFERALLKVTSAQAVEQKLRKPTEEKLTKDDVLEGLVGAVLARIPEPQFEGQTKEKLGSSVASKIVEEVVVEQLTEFFTARKTKTAGKQILTKICNAAKVRIKARDDRDKLRERNKVSNAPMPSKLKDCRIHTLADSELFLIEGDSAGGTALLARDSGTQAILPLRGKVLNALNSKESAILNNQECVSLFTALGCGFKANFDITKLRYGKLIIMTDADQDGHHIRSLILALLWVYLRPLVEAGHVYAAVPPLYEIRYMKSGKKQRRYAFDPSELPAIIEDIQKVDKVSRDKISFLRMKGLGEANADVLRETTMGKTTRRLRQIPVSEPEEATRVLTTIMGSDSDNRKEIVLDAFKQTNVAEVM